MGTSEPVLTKWYLDCVDDAGNVAIAYCARVAWMKVSLSYSSVIINRDGATHAREHIGAIRFPTIDGDVLEWDAPGIVLHVSMRGRAPGCSSTLIEGVDWHCLLPSAEATFQIDGETMRGSGYAERLDMTIAPWHLPIDELRWGRVAAPDAAVTWIDWRGSHPLTKIFADGAEVAGSVSDDRIMAGELSVVVGRDRVIRDEVLGSTLRGIGPLRQLLPRRIVDARETKWCGRATVDRKGVTVATTWAVHEIVRFV